MKNKVMLGICMSAIVILSLWAPRVMAYSDYNNGCQNCHGSWTGGSYVSAAAQDGANWNTSLHSGHRAFASCSTCHVQIGDVPNIDGPSGDGLDSCIGCHGREEDANNLGVGSGRGAGLRQHHWVNGIDCSGCHGDSNPNLFTPVGEDVSAARYPNLNIDPCSDAVFGNYGLDNDGDNLYDDNDPDCSSSPVCGNKILETGEQCDDGNTIDGDGCQADCQLPVCGDNIIDSGEQCDDGNTVSGDGCQADCQLPVCGDGNVDTGEQCDDGNTTDGDGCSSTCQTESPAPYCGDGNVDAGEQCDDGNTTDGDGCNSTCQTESPAPYCGDGNVDTGEQCDDGNNTSGDGCENDCTLTPPPVPEPVCGDGNVDAGEICDDGNTVTEIDCSYGEATCLACSADCETILGLTGPYCGDGIVNGNEQCDDGNNTNGDGCSADCQLPLSSVCNDAEQPVITEMEYNRGDQALHIKGQAASGSSLTIIKSDTGKILADGIRINDGQWEAEIKNVGRSLQTISVLSSNGCSVVQPVETTRGNRDEHYERGRTTRGETKDNRFDD